jgi:hypothetical protein
MELHGIPGNYTEMHGIPSDSGIGSDSRNSGIGWNSQEFRVIQYNSVSTQFPEFRPIPELEAIPGIPESDGIP